MKYFWICVTICVSVVSICITVETIKNKPPQLTDRTAQIIWAATHGSNSCVISNETLLKIVKAAIDSTKR